ncbi:hypothetical protein BC830DRAFT_705111 [Chytriomyces sp. MP71]|nr:hypothetical protein BC830DRAFT_705111 [Chytriomyces sp. MP71]
MSENVEARSLVAAAAPSSARSASGGPVHASSVLARDGVQAPGSPPSVACVSRVPQPDSLGAACSRGTDPLVPLSTASVDAHRESSQFGTLAADTLPHQQLQTLSTATLMKSAPVQQSETWALSPLTQPDARCEPRDAKQTQATTVPNSASEEPADKGRPCLHDVVEAHADLSVSVHESESISSFAEHSRSKEAIASSETINEVVTDITVQGMEQSQMIVAMSGAMEEADPQAESMRVDALDVADCPSQQHSGFVPCTTALGCGEGSHFCADAMLPGHLSLSAMKPTVPSTACDIAAMQELEFAPLTMPSYSGESDAIIDVSVRIPISRNMAATADDVARHEHGALEFPVIGLADVVKTDSNIEVIGTVVNSNVGLSDEVDGSMTCAYPAQRAESASDDQASKNNVFDSTAENNLEASDALDNQMLALHVDSSLDCTERTTACGIVMEEVGVGIVRDMPEELEGRDLAFSEHANERKARQMNSGIKLSDADAEASDSCAVEAKTDTRCPTVNHIFKFRHSAESEVDTVIYDDSCDAPEKEPAELHPVDPSLSLTQLADSGKMPSCGMSDSNPVVLNTNSTFVTHREPLSESAKAKNIEEYGVIPVALVIPPTHIDKEKVVGLTTFKPNNLESMEKEAARSLTTDLLVMNVEAQEISIPQGFSLAITVPLLPHEFDKSRNEEAGQDVFAASKFQSAAKQTLATKNASNSEQLSLPIVARALSNSTSGKSPLAPRPALFKKPFKVPFKLHPLPPQSQR